MKVILSIFLAKRERKRKRERERERERERDYYMWLLCDYLYKETSHEKKET